MDEHDDLMPNHLFISLRYEFKATRVMDRRLSPTTIKIKADISTLEDESEEYGPRMEIALSKMSYWVEQILDGSIIFYSDNDWALDSFMDGAQPATHNSVVLTPDDPTDACLAELLICKLKALAGGAFEFHAIDIESSDGRGMGFTFVGGRPGESFPENEEWLTDHNYFSKPWWHRGDASSLDVVPDEDADLNEPPAWAFSLGFIADQMAHSVGPKANVVRPEFRPRVIEGGKAE